MLARMYKWPQFSYVANDALKWGNHRGERSGSFLSSETIYDPAIPLLVWERKTHIHKKACIRMFIGASVLRAHDWKQPENSSIGE